MNTQGLPALPDDVHLEIISHFFSLPVPTEREQEAVDVKGLRDRHLALRSLSQTCRSLRPFYLRYLWQRIEVFDGMETDKGSLQFVDLTHRRRRGEVTTVNKLYVEELSRQLEIVTIRDSSLALHVNILNLTVVEEYFGSMLPELAQCITLLPNLHTVQFNFRIDIIIFNKARDVFKAHRYPQIRTACLSSSAYFFIACCPNLRRVMSYNYLPEVGLLEYVIQHCPQVEVLAPLFAFAPLTRMILKLKNLRDVSLDCAFLMERKADLEALSQLSHLHTIRIRVDIDGYKSFQPRSELDMTSEDVKDCVEWGRRILSGHETGEVHRVIVIYKDRETEIISEH